MPGDNRGHGCERTLGMRIQDVEWNIVGDEEAQIDVRVAIRGAERCAPAFPSGQYIRKRLKHDANRFNYPIPVFATRCRHGWSRRLTYRISRAADRRQICACEFDDWLGQGVPTQKWTPVS